VASPEHYVLSMLTMMSPTLRHLCHAAALAAALPGSHLVLRWRDGTERDVGGHPCCDVLTPLWRDAVLQCAATASLLPHELLFGVPGAPAVELRAGAGQEDVGGGVYRCDGVDLFATSLAPHQVLDAVTTCAAPGHARIGVRRDELAGVTLVAVHHLVGPPPGDARLAWSLAMACAVGEVSLTV
jgi:hypothetical protein